MITSLFSRITINVFGCLYPAYASFKAVRAKNVQDYVKWMMYWIVFAIFSCIETFTDIFLFWLPFYYEIKVLLVFWLLSPVTNGSSILYRHFVHPFLKHKENEIDHCIVHVRQQSYATLMEFARKALRQFSVFIRDIVHLNFRAVSQQLINIQHVNKTCPDIVITSINGIDSKVDDNNLSEPEGEDEIDSNGTNKVFRKTRKGGSVKVSDGVASKRKPKVERGRGKTNAVDKVKVIA